MNASQREYFRQKLLEWRSNLLKESQETLESLQLENIAAPDMADRATNESDRALELRTRDRQRKLIGKIDVHCSELKMGLTGIAKKRLSLISLQRLEAAHCNPKRGSSKNANERMERTRRDD